MKRKRTGFGKQLTELHRWNAWLVAVLAVSGLLLGWSVVRQLGEGRIWIRQLHIAIGVLSGVPIVMYMPLMKRHWRQLRPRPRQKGNLGGVLFLLAGWLVSGALLWQLRHFPTRWGNYAMWVHQLLTYVGLPYIVYHSVSRLRWMKQPFRRAIRPFDAETEPDEAGGNGSDSSRTPAWSGSEPGMAAREARGSGAGTGQHMPGPWMDRRKFLKMSLGIAMAAVALPPLYRWLSSVPGGSSFAPGVGPNAGDNPNRMLPDPQPLPESVQVVGGGAEGRFQVYSVTRLPKFDSVSWRFTLDGLVDRPAVWNWEQFLRLSRKVQVSDFHCVTGWSVYNNTWEGIPLAQLLDEAGVKPEATVVKFYSGDGAYSDALTLEQARMEDVMVAVLHDGKPIHRDFGGPVRLIVPRMYAYKSVKWLKRIELIDKEHIGYWEERGYANDAWLKGQGLQT